MHRGLGAAVWAGTWEYVGVSGTPPGQAERIREAQLRGLTRAPGIPQLIPAQPLTPAPARRLTTSKMRIEENKQCARAHIPRLLIPLPVFALARSLLAICTMFSACPADIW